MKKGDVVMVHPSVKKPKFGWGAIDRDDIGVYLGQDISSDSMPGEVIVNFPKQERWCGIADELILISGIEGEPGMPGPPGLTGMQGIPGIPGESNNMKTRAGTEWRFQSIATLDIDYGEISSELCKANPLALIEAIGKNKETCGVMIHESLVVKAEVCSLPMPKGKQFEVNNCIVVKTTKQEFSDWINWAKKTKQANWPSKYHRKCVIKVTLAKI